MAKELNGGASIGSILSWNRSSFAGVVNALRRFVSILRQSVAADPQQGASVTAEAPFFRRYKPFAPRGIAA